MIAMYSLDTQNIVRTFANINTNEIKLDDLYAEYFWGEVVLMSDYSDDVIYLKKVDVLDFFLHLHERLRHVAKYGDHMELSNIYENYYIHISSVDDMLLLKDIYTNKSIKVRYTDAIERSAFCFRCLLSQIQCCIPSIRQIEGWDTVARKYNVSPG